MVNFKKLVAILCSATMVIGASVTAFAAEPESSAGTGNIVAYSIDTVTVPTELKVSFNPQGWDIYLDAATDSTAKTNAQIVSLNYAVSSMATMNRKFTVSFEASGTPGSTGDPVVFVDSADKAAPKTDDNPDGAEFGELKLYLAAAGGQALVTESRDGTAFEISDQGVPNITKALLADVTMDAATGGNQVFVAGEDKAETEIAFSLGKATYELKDDAHPTFETTQEQFKEMVQPATLGEIVGFTFTGAMNSNADWTKANLSAISITPEYEFGDADGTEEAVTGGAKNQIKPAGAVTVLTGSYDSTNTRYQIALPEGVVISNVSEVTNIAVNGATITDIATNGNGAVVRVNRSTVSAALGTDWPTTNELVFTFTIGSTNYKSTMSKN